MCPVLTTSRKSPIVPDYVGLIELSLWMMLD